MNLFRDIKISHAISSSDAHQTAASGTINGAIIDMAGYDGIAALVNFGRVAAATDASITVKWQSGTASDLTDAADLEGTSLAMTGADDNKSLLSSVYHPLERYVRIQVNRGSATAEVIANYFQYGPGKAPVTHATAVTGSEYHQSPAEGTA